MANPLVTYSMLNYIYIYVFNRVFEPIVCQGTKTQTKKPNPHSSDFSGANSFQRFAAFELFQIKKPAPRRTRGHQHMLGYRSYENESNHGGGGGGRNLYELSG